MNDNDVDLSLKGPMARNVARSLLNALDVPPESITEFRAVVETEVGDGGSESIIDTHGEHAGEIAYAMFNGVDWAEYPPSDLHIELKAAETDDGDDGDDRDDDRGDTDEPETVTCEDCGKVLTVGPEKAPRMVLAGHKRACEGNRAEAGETEPVDGDASAGGQAAEPNGDETFEARREAAQGREVQNPPNREGQPNMRMEPVVDQPVPINANTRIHEALWALQEYASEHDNEWVGTPELYEFSSMDFPAKSTVSVAMSEAFTRHALVERRPRNDGVQGGEYRLNDAGRAEIKSKGEPTGGDSNG